MSNYKLYPKLSSTAIGNDFLKSPLGFIDIGARGGIHELIKPLGDMASSIAFEPDPDAVVDETTVVNDNLVIERVGLGSTPGNKQLHLTKNPAASSIYPPVEHTVARYGMKPPAPTGDIIDIPIHRLDDVLKSKYSHRPYAAEIIKLDTQGYELEILKGAVNTLKKQTVALFVEVEFLRIYDDQPLFSEVEQYLRQLGLSFYGFDSLHYRSTNRFDHNLYPNMRERLYWADAVFFKDPFDHAESSSLSQRSLYTLYTSAVLLGYIDFALEILDEIDISDSERSQLRQAALDKGHISQDKSAQLVRDLSSMIAKNPEFANQTIGSWIAERHPFGDFQTTA